MIILAIDLGGTHSPMEKQIRKMTRKLRIIEARFDNMEARLDNLNENDPLVEPPYLYVCGYQDKFDETRTTMTYDKLFMNHTNVEMSGGLDIITGIFRSPVAGIYSVTFATSNYANKNDSSVQMLFKKNAGYLGESMTKSANRGASEGYIFENMGKDLLLFLGEGETLELYCFDCYEVYGTTICLTLLKADNGTSAGLNMDLSLDGQVDPFLEIKKN